MMKAHPVADLFPMMDGEELEDLAENIRVNGLNLPIIIDGDILIEGRNRLRACEIAGVKPRFEPLGDRDPIALILSLNIARRHMTKGALAMVAARARLLDSNKNSQETVARSISASQTRISQAGTVLDYASDLADSVVSGSLGLDAAYKTALVRKRDALTLENRLERLPPEFAEMVKEGRLSITEAEAARDAREEKEDAARDALVTALRKILENVAVVAQAPETELTSGLLSPEFRHQFGRRDGLDELTKGLDQTHQLVELIRKILNQVGPVIAEHEERRRRDFRGHAAMKKEVARERLGVARERIGERRLNGHG
jgi:hypothetical protein